MISAGWCGWFIHNSIIDYLSNDVVTKTDVKYVNNIILPIISFCDINRFNTNYSNNFFTQILGQFPDLVGLNEFSKIIANIGEYNNTIFDKNANKIDINDLIIYCTMGYGTKCDLSNDFQAYYDVNYGNCFRFNSGINNNGENVPFKYIKQSGILNAFELELFVGKAKENDNIFSKENGFILFINNQTFDSTLAEGLFISAGTSTRIIINKYSMKKSPSPYSECIDGLNSIDSYKSDTYRKTFSPNRTYHYTDCIYVCYQKYIADKCKCQSGFFNLVFDTTLDRCGSKIADQIDCESIYSTEFYKISSTNIDKCDCPVECEKSGYTFTSSIAEFPTRNYWNYLKNNGLIKSKFSNKGEISYQDLKESVARVVIFYDELKETLVTQNIKVGMADLVSNVGGLLGLFLGYLKNYLTILFFI